MQNRYKHFNWYSYPQLTEFRLLLLLLLFLQMCPFIFKEKVNKNRYVYGENLQRDALERNDR